MAITKAITVDQGTTFEEDFLVHVGVNFPLDLTGYKARMQVRDDFDTNTTRLNLSNTTGKLIILPVNGKVTISLVPSDTSGIKFAGPKYKGIYDLEIESPQGDVIRVAQGSFTLLREVTR